MSKNPWHERQKQYDNEMSEQEDHPKQETDPLLDEKIDQELADMEEIEREMDVDTKSAEELRDDVISLKDELKESHDKLLRAHAEMDNIRRRATTDIQKAHQYGLEKFAGALLPIVDSLEKAIESAKEDPNFEGVKLTLTIFLNELKKVGVEQIDPINRPFDPTLHEAISMQPSSDHPANTVLSVLQKGYGLNGRVIRPALVVVSKKA